MLGALVVWKNFSITNPRNSKTTKVKTMNKYRVRLVNGSKKEVHATKIKDTGDTWIFYNGDDPIFWSQKTQTETIEMVEKDDTNIRLSTFRSLRKGLHSALGLIDQIEKMYELKMPPLLQEQIKDLREIAGKDQETD